MSYLDLTIRVLAAVLVIVAATTICGRIALSVRQPRVVGEMLAGVLLGPSLLGAVAPSVQELLFPEGVKGVLYVLSTIGLTYYMFLVGATVDHRTMDRTMVRRSVSIAGVGIMLPFALAAVVAVTFYSQLAAPGVSRLGFVLFLGGALSVTAFPMLARILQERGLAGTVLGSTSLLAGAIDDAVAWALLAIVVATAGASGASGALITIVGAAVFAVVMLTLGRRLLAPVGRRIELAGSVPQGTMAMILLLVIGAAWFTEAIGVFAVFGGFVMGMSMPHSPVLRRELEAKLMDFNRILLLPIFFAFSGLNTQLAGLNDFSVLLPTVAAIAAACAGKYLGCGVAAGWSGMPWRQAWAVGGLMNARGLMILIFINVGLAHGLVTPELFAILVLIAIITTAAAMPIYQFHLPPQQEATLNSAGPNGATTTATVDAGVAVGAGVAAGAETAPDDPRSPQ